MKCLLLFSLVSTSVFAFSIKSLNGIWPRPVVTHPSSFLYNMASTSTGNTEEPTFQRHQIKNSEKLLPKLLGLGTGLFSLATVALAGDEIEMADLPPPYVPAIFAVVLLVGVGILTGSLGDVMDEESQLGMQSGARAKKEIERTRSSYFKKK